MILWATHLVSRSCNKSTASSVYANLAPQAGVTHVTSVGESAEAGSEVALRELLRAS